MYRRPAIQHTGLAAFMLTLMVVLFSAWGPRVPGTEQYMPHGVCYAWDANLIRLSVVADSLIGLAYTAIPIILVTFIRKRTDLPFNWMFVLFGIFIIACGLTHWLEVYTLWVPNYWLLGGVKAITAAASVPTAILLFLLIKPALAIPSIRQLTDAKDALEAAHAQLEARVQERTAELVAANQKLEEQTKKVMLADKRKTEFLAILSHELRNPIHAIHMNAQFLKYSVKGADHVQACNVIERQVHHTNRLLSDLSNAMKNNEGTLQLECVDLRDVVTQSVQTMAPKLTEKEQEVVCDMPEQPVMTPGDTTRLCQALVNLLSNASSYSPNQSTVRVSLTVVNDQARIEVLDQGIGFDSTEGGELFNLFLRGERAKRISVNGLGIGLHLAREILIAHGGHLSATSPGLNKGSSFVMVLPLENC
jgi:signal transduction histidine kinase